MTSCESHCITPCLRTIPCWSIALRRRRAHCVQQQQLYSCLVDDSLITFYIYTIAGEQHFIPNLFDIFDICDCGSQWLFFLWLSYDRTSYSSSTMSLSKLLFLNCDDLLVTNRKFLSDPRKCDALAGCNSSLHWNLTKIFGNGKLDFFDLTWRSLPDGPVPCLLDGKL